MYDTWEPNPLGKHLDDVWDLQPIMPSSRERLSYPTQKPLALLERIILAATNEGDTVLDPFCGCGTAVCSASIREAQSPVDWDRPHAPGDYRHEEAPPGELSLHRLQRRRRAGGHSERTSASVLSHK